MGIRLLILYKSRILPEDVPCHSEVNWTIVIIEILVILRVSLPLFRKRCMNGMILVSWEDWICVAPIKKDTPPLC